jgi:hypothetical protein
MARPRFETRVPSSSNTGATITGGGGGGGGSSGTVQGTGECSSSHNKVVKLRLHLIIVMPLSFFLSHFYFFSSSFSFFSPSTFCIHSKCQCH